MKKVYWTKIATDHLLAIHEYIAQTSPQYANLIVDKITRRSQQLEMFPQSGRKVKGDDTREIIEGKHRIVYRIEQERIDVVAVLHQAQSPDQSETSE